MTDDELEILARYLRRTGYGLWTATLHGHRIEEHQAVHGRMNDLTPGSLVFESTTIIQSKGTTDLDSVGFLERIEFEPMSIDGWDEDEDGPPPLERATYIRTLDGRSFRWVNATFLSFPDQIWSSLGDGWFGERIPPHEAAAS